MANTADPHTRAIAEHLEDALLPLALALEEAREVGRALHAQSIVAVIAQIEDLRQRNEEYDPEIDSPDFPRVIRYGPVPRATRVAVARDFTRAIYRSIDGSTARAFRTPHFVVFPMVEGEHRRRSEPINLGTLAEANAYLWDEPDELEAARGRRVDE